MSAVATKPRAKSAPQIARGLAAVETAAGETGADGLDETRIEADPVGNCYAAFEGTNAAAVFQAAANEAGEAMYWGLLTLAETALQAALQAEETVDINLWNKASECFEQAIAVCSALNGGGGEDNALLYAGESLLGLAKVEVDAVIERLAHTVPNRSAA